jgi:hypothetical protein
MSTARGGSAVEQHDDPHDPALADVDHEEHPGTPRRSRRGILLGGVAAAASGVAGVALGYRFRTQIRDVKLRALAYPLHVPGGMDDFQRNADAIVARRNQQTAETVAALKARYEEPVFGRVRVWDLVEKLALCIDASDLRLFCASQLVHAQQIFAAMQRNGVEDPDMLLLALIHDLGKVLLLAAAAPEDVVGVTRRIAGGEPGAGLDHALFQFGHGEFLYSRIQGLVPDHVAWVARFHNISVSENRPLMSERERVWADKYLVPFSRFDGGFVSPYALPRVDLAQCRDLVERAFPSPILV